MYILYTIVFFWTIFLVGPLIAMDTLNSSCIIKQCLLYEEIEVGIIFDKKERRIFDILFELRW